MELLCDPRRRSILQTLYQVPGTELLETFSKTMGCKIFDQPVVPVIIALTYILFVCVDDSWLSILANSFATRACNANC